MSDVPSDPTPTAAPPPRRTTITLPTPSLVVLVGPSGAGKSTFARRHFLPTEVVSSDACRGLVADDENDQTVTGEAFDLLHTIVDKRLALGRLTVVDATSVQPHARKSLIDLARRHHVFATAIVFDVPRQVCEVRNAARPDRQFGPHVVRQQHQQMRRSIRGLPREGFRRVFSLRSEAEVDLAVVERERLWNDRREDHGPFDIIGDVHGCAVELTALIDRLGYPVDADGRVGPHPDGRRVLLLGDLVDRGPGVVAVLKTAMQMVGDGVALCIPGNHENKLGCALAGRKVQRTHGLAESLEQLEAEPPELRAEVARFIDGLVSHYVLDDGNLVVAHAGLKESMQGRSSGAVRSFALYGDTTGETDEFGLPVRYAWADDYRGKALVVYGHTPVPEATFVNNTICIDTGCVFGGKLTALRYPERELVSVDAARTYWEPARPLRPAPGAADAREPALLDIDDVLGKRIVSVGLLPSVTVREENAVPALEVMSRFAVDPRWLAYLPPTMAPTETALDGSQLEHPAQAFADFRQAGVTQLVCEEKHMGSRAVVVVCRDRDAARRRFLVDLDDPVDPVDPIGPADARTGAGTAGDAVGGAGSAVGVVHTRTGRSFFTDAATEAAVLARVGRALDAAGLWDELGTDWLILDAELLPWSLKAGELLRRQYASVGAAARAETASALDALRAAEARGVALGDLVEERTRHHAAALGFTDAYRRYCWDVGSIDDLVLAPFQVLAGEGEVYARRNHLWHLGVFERLHAADPGLIRLTASRTVELAAAGADPSPSELDATAWWTALTAEGGEGMVVKPLDAVVQIQGQLVQPGIKCRGSEYLRIIYGPDYLAPRNLDRLRRRRLGHKRSLALREFALGIEALDRFVHHEPLHRVHECVFAVLALESEPVDPRL